MQKEWKRVKKACGTSWTLWQQIHNICIVGTPEGAEKEKGAKSYFKKLTIEAFQRWEGNECTVP